MLGREKLLFYCLYNCSHYAIEKSHGFKNKLIRKFETFSGKDTRPIFSSNECLFSIAWKKVNY